MKKQKYMRIGSAALGAVIIGLAFTRCSPIAPSVSKTSLYGPRQKVALAEPAPVPISQPSLPESAKIVKFETKLLGETSFYTLDFDSEKQSLTTLSEELTHEQFERLRTDGKTELKIKSSVPKKITVVFRVSDQALLNADDVSGFDSSLDPLVDEKWELKIADSVTKELSEYVLKHLEAVTVVFDTKEETR